MAPTFVRQNVRAMHGYSPGEQPAMGERVIKLNTNENPFPPSPKVMQAIREVEPELLRRYPHPLADDFRRAAAKVLGVTPDMILAGNGSDDILTIATRTFIPPGGTLAFPSPTYSLYSILAGLEEASIAKVPWNDGWTLPIDALVATNANAIYLVNPNAPSGSIVPPSVVSDLANKFPRLLLVDEAYADFADTNCLDLVHKHANVVISRSLSKSYSLAGLRFGYAVAHPTVIREMMKVKDSYNCDAIAIAAATAAVQDQDYARMTWDHVRSERTRLTTELTAHGFTVLPSQANFLLARVPGDGGGAMYDALKRMGILVRHFDSDELRAYIRITVGTTTENNALLGGIRELLTHEKAA
ncbi:MAG TPA: histidinol-phosphate transaminase [Tepidisphaeraceae bacterium]|jgi:histidinol-phosphate aminotransferase